MKRPFSYRLLVLPLALLAQGCRQSPGPAPGDGATADLAGAWRSRIQFHSGAFAAIKDLEFMYVYNLGGTLTESSNYDAAPPVPPAYGIWRRIGASTFETRYEFYVTRAPAAGEIATAGGWLPAGRGVLMETITLASNGQSYTSRIRYDALDQAGQPVEGGGEGEGRGVRTAF